MLVHVDTAAAALLLLLDEEEASGLSKLAFLLKGFGLEWTIVNKEFTPLIGQH